MILFIIKTKKHIQKDKDLSEISSIQKRPLAKPLLHYQKQFKNRDTAICEAFKSGGYSMKEIGDFFGFHYSRISRIVKLEQELARNKI